MIIPAFVMQIEHTWQVVSFQHRTRRLTAVAGAERGRAGGGACQARRGAEREARARRDAAGRPASCSANAADGHHLCLSKHCGRKGVHLCSGFSITALPDHLDGAMMEQRKKYNSRDHASMPHPCRIHVLADRALVVKIGFVSFW